MLKAVTAKSIEGPFLKNNEDAYEFDLSKGIFTLVDALGGVNIGDKAAHYVTNQVVKSFKEGPIEEDKTLPYFYDPRYLLELNVLLNSLHKLHEEIYEKNLEQDYSLRGAVSGSFWVTSNSILNNVNIGNTCSFLIRHGNLSLIQAPDDLLLSGNGDKNFCLPATALGMYRQLHYSVKELRVQKDDKVLILSDGVYPHLSHREILSFFMQKSHPSDLVEGLLNLANQNGNRDNQTAMLLEF